MAIKFVDKSNAPKVKQPKINVARKVLLIFAIIGLVCLFLCMFARLSPLFFMGPITVFWLFAMLIPTACTLGSVWASEGYRNFIAGLLQFMSDAINASPKIDEAIKMILPYVGAVSLALVIAHAIIAFIAYKKAPEVENNKKQMLVGFILFGVGVIFFTIGLIVTFAL